MRAFLIMAAALAAAAPTRAADLTDWNVSPFSLSWDDWAMTVGGKASAAAYWSDQESGIARDGVTGSALLVARVERQLDNGWELSANGALLPWHDAQSGDSYGDRFFEKEYVALQTQYGRIELGQQDGASYALSVTGPKVDDAVAIDNANTTFFREPTTGRTLIDIFPIRTAEFATDNFAKISYYSPRLFGIQIAGSYAPYEARDGLPFVSEGRSLPDRQTNMLEAGANYQRDVGSISSETYVGVVIAHDDARTAGHGDLQDWGLGASFGYDIEPVKLSFGGAYRQSNAYAFDIEDAFERGDTHAVRLSTTAAIGPWILGVEFVDGLAGHEATLPRLHETGYEPSVAYVVNSNLQLTLGWQRLSFARDSGVFYNAKPNVAMQAAFLHLKFHV